MKCLNNKKGQKLILNIMLAIIVFIFALAFIKPTVDVTTDARNETNLNCTDNDLLSSADNATCIIVDEIVFYFISTIVALSVALIAGSRTFHGIVAAISVYIIIVVLINPLKDLIIIARDASHMDCGNAAASVASKLGCLVIDIWLFYLIVTVLAAATTFMFAKKAVPKIFGEEK